MERTYIKDLKEYIGKEVRVRGRVDTIRDQGKIIFLLIRDKTSKAQFVCWHENEELFKSVKTLTLESVVDIKGLVKEAKQVSIGYEVEIQSLIIDSLSNTPLPIVIEQEHSSNISALEKRIDFRYLDLRSSKNQLMMEISTLMNNCLRVYCINNGFREIQAPRIISAASESGANVFEVKYFPPVKRYGGLIPTLLPTFSPIK
jgi:aspartyl-tRNA synthetase